MSIVFFCSRFCRLLLLGGAVAACGADPGADPARSANATAGDTAATRYQREYVYLGERGESPLVVPFVFRAVQRSDAIERTARAALAHGSTWDPFLDESWDTPTQSGVWRVVPNGNLRILAGGPAELEAIRFEQGERSLRLELQRPLTGWQQGNTARFRLVTGRLRLGAESTPGVVLESVQILRPGAGRRDSDWLFLTAGDSLRLVLAESLPRTTTGAARGFAWSWSAQGERSWEQAEVRWLEVRSYEEARRDIPLHWSFSTPGGEVRGEVSAMGMEPSVGPERPGRRSVEIRYTVEGWVELDGRRSAVMGTIRHVQE
jgi:hypothetical protein